MIFMSDDLRNTSFDNKFKGYNPEQVEDFIDKVLECYDSLADEYLNLEKNFKELTEKIGDIEATKQNAVKLVSAAKLEGDAVIEAAKKKAEKIIADAKAEASQIERDANSIVNSQNRASENLKAESERLREDIIRVCSEHIKAASAIDGDALIESLLSDIENEKAELADLTQQQADGIDDISADECVAQKEDDGDEKKNLFDTSFLRPSAGEGNPDAKIFTRQAHIGSFAAGASADSARRVRSDSSTIADLATSLKNESKEENSVFSAPKVEKRQSYGEMMEQLGAKKKSTNGRDPLKFIK
jgi:DivIVA domain-containing protein